MLEGTVLIPVSMLQSNSVQYLINDDVAYIKMFSVQNAEVQQSMTFLPSAYCYAV